MPLHRITAEEFQLLASTQKGLEDDTIVVKSSVGLLKATDTDTRTATFKLSSEDVDRDRDIINQSGWKMDNYLKNPVVLWGHQYGMPPVGSCSSLQLKGSDLLGDCNFFDSETYAWADTIYRLVKAGGLRACSVGFKPIKYNYNAERGGVDIEEQELLEWSIVSVPANPHALVQLSASLPEGDQILKSFVKGCEQVLDSYYGCEGVWIPRTQVEKAFEVINKSGLIAPPATKAAVTVEVKPPAGETVELPAVSDESKCGDFLEIDDATVLELAEELVEYDAKDLHGIIENIVKTAVQSIVADAITETQAKIDYQFGRVR